MGKGIRKELKVILLPIIYSILILTPISVGCIVFIVRSPEKYRIIWSMLNAQLIFGRTLDTIAITHFPLPIVTMTEIKATALYIFCIIRIHDEEGWNTQMNVANNDCFN